MSESVSPTAVSYTHLIIYTASLNNHKNCRYIGYDTKRPSTFSTRSFLMY